MVDKLEPIKIYLVWFSVERDEENKDCLVSIHRDLDDAVYSIDTWYFEDRQNYWIMSVKVR